MTCNHDFRELTAVIESGIDENNTDHTHDPLIVDYVACVICGEMADDTAVDDKQLVGGVLKRMHQNFRDAMARGNWLYHNGSDVRYFDDEEGFTHHNTGDFIKYDEAFQFWCQSKRTQTPPPF